MKTIKRTYLLFCALFLITSSLSYAASTSTVWFGGLGGKEKVDKTTYTLYGGTFGARLSNHFAIGAYYLTSNSKSASGPGYSIKVTHTMMGGQPMLIWGDGVMFFLGARIGMSEAKGDLTVGRVTVGTSSSGLGVGPVLGFDFKLGKVISLGVEAGYQIVTGDSTYHVSTGLGSLKFWF